MKLTFVTACVACTYVSTWGSDIKSISILWVAVKRFEKMLYLIQVRFDEQTFIIRLNFYTTLHVWIFKYTQTFVASFFILKYGENLPSFSKFTNYWTYDIPLHSHHWLILHAVLHGFKPLKFCYPSLNNTHAKKCTFNKYFNVIAHTIST